MRIREVPTRRTGTAGAGFSATPEAVVVTGAMARAPSHCGFESGVFPRGDTPLWRRDADRADAECDERPALFKATASAALNPKIDTDRAPAYATLAGGHACKTRADYEARNTFVEGDDP